MSEERNCSVATPAELQCDICGSFHKTTHSLKQHKVNKHNWNFTECSICHVKARLEDTMKKHTALRHMEQRQPSPNIWVKKQCQSPTYEYTYNGEKFRGLKSFFNSSKTRLFENLIFDLYNIATNIVLFLGVCIEIEYTLNGELVIEMMTFAKEMKTFSDVLLITVGYTNLVQGLSEAVSKLKQGLQGNYTMTIVYAIVRLDKWRPLVRDDEIVLPTEITSKMDVVEVVSNDDYNFKWAIISALHNSIKNVETTGPLSTYQIENISDRIIVMNESVIDFRGLDFPTPLRDLSIFEEANTSISINVFGYEQNEFSKDVEIIGPLYRCKALKKRHINLLLIGSPELNNYRYCWIKNMSKMLQAQRVSHFCRSHICFFCMDSFSTADKLKTHKRNCSGILVPLKGENPFSANMCNVKKPITNVKKYRLPLPFCVFANYETMEPTTGLTKDIRPCAFGFYIKCNFNTNLCTTFSSEGEYCASNFVENLIASTERLFKTYVHTDEVHTGLTPKQQAAQTNNASCCVCHKTIPEGERENLFYKPTKRFIGPSHRQECSQYFNRKTYVPVFLPSLEDTPLFITHLDKYPGLTKWLYDNNNVPTSISKYCELFAGCVLEFRFLSLNLYIGNQTDCISSLMKFNDFKIMKDAIQDDEKIYLMRQKLFPYKYATSFDKLQETELPPKLWFDDFGTEAYEMAKNVWREFKCVTLMDFLMVYLQSEILLQVDIFEFFNSRQKGSNSLKNLHYDLKYKITRKIL